MPRIYALHALELTIMENICRMMMACTRCVCVCALASAICTMIGLILYNVSHIYFELRAQAYQVSIIMVVVAGGITGYGYLQMHRIFDWFVIESTNVCESPSTSSIYARSFSYIRY